MVLELSEAPSLTSRTRRARGSVRELSKDKSAGAGCPFEPYEPHTELPCITVDGPYKSDGVQEPPSHEKSRRPLVETSTSEEEKSPNQGRINVH